MSRGGLPSAGAASVSVRTLHPGTKLTLARCCIGEPGLVVEHCGDELLVADAQLRTNPTISHYIGNGHFTHISSPMHTT